MEERTHQTGAPRIGLPRQTPSRFAIVFWVAFGVSALLVAGQITFVLSFTPLVIRMAEQVGVTLPAPLAFAHIVGPVGLFLCYSVIDATLFAIFAWLAKRYWVGLLFVPALLYLAGAFGALWIFAAEIAASR